MNEPNMHNSEPNKNFWKELLKGPFLPLLLTIPTYFLETMHLTHFAKEAKIINENISKAIIAILFISLPLFLIWNWALRHKILKTEEKDENGELKAKEEMSRQWSRIIISTILSMLLIILAFISYFKESPCEPIKDEEYGYIYNVVKPEFENGDSLESIILQTPEYTKETIMQKVHIYEDNIVKKYIQSSSHAKLKQSCRNELDSGIHETLNSDISKIEDTIAIMIELSDTLNSLNLASDSDKIEYQISFIRNTYKILNNTSIKIYTDGNIAISGRCDCNTFRQYIDYFFLQNPANKYQVVKFDLNPDKTIKTIYLNKKL